jgi:phosphate uptake regulator
MRAGADDREIRKVQFTGRSTYILSLPKKWVQEMDLAAGTPVTIVRAPDNSLSISPTASEHSEPLEEVTTVIAATDSSNSLRRRVVSIYLAGYSIIHLKFKSGRVSPTLRDAVREIVRRNLVGTEMIADAVDSISLQVLLSLPELSLNTAIRRMYLIAMSMHKDAVSALGEHNQGLAKEVIRCDDEVDRFSLYVLRNLVLATQNSRALREMGMKQPSDILSYRVAVKSIERVADHASRIAEHVISLNEKVPRDSMQKIEKMSHHARTVMDDAVESLLQRDYNQADKTVDNAEKITALEAEAIGVIEKEKIKDTATLKLALENIRRTAEYASDIAEAALNETIDEVIEKKLVGSKRH